MPHGGGHSLPPGVVPSPVIAGSNAAAHAAAVAAAKNKNKGMKSTLGRCNSISSLNSIMSKLITHLRSFSGSLAKRTNS